MSRSSLPSPALVVASLALLFALAGTGIASVAQVPPKNSVGTAQLKNNAVNAAKIASNAVTASEIASNAVGAAEIASNAVTAAEIASNAVTSAELASGAVTAADVASGVIPPSEGHVRFQNGPFAIPAALTTLSSLTISNAGSYIIWAKAYITVTSGATITVTCRVEADADFDQARTSMGGDASQTISLIVAHVFAAAGSINFRCSGTGEATANFIKIAAMRVGTLTNTG
jgi:hypothetical protein